MSDTSASSDANPGKPYQPIVSQRLSALFLDVNGPPRLDMATISNRELLESCLVTLNEINRRAASGADEATDYLIRLSVQATRLLTNRIKNPSEFLLSIARCNTTWPFFYSPKRGMLSEYDQVLARLEIGKNSQINVSPASRWSWNTEARAWAAKIHLSVQDLKSNVDGHKTDFPQGHIEWTRWTKAAYELPPLTKATARQWMLDFGRQLILDATKGHPEDDPKLRKMVESWTRNKSAKAGSKTAETNIRNDIFRLVEQALKGMASPP